MIRKMSKAEKTARHLPLEEDYWIDTDYYAYSSERKINLKTGKDEVASKKKLGFWAWLKILFS